MRNRLLKHILFWLLYTCVYAYLSASFPAKSDLAFSFPMRFFRFWVTECMQLPIKLIVTYGALYWVFPKYILEQKYIKAILITTISLTGLVLVSRLITFYIAYPYLYNEYPDYELVSTKRFLYSFLDLFTALASAATVKLVSDRLKLKKREELLQKEKLIAELQFLKAQINPHFLFNTLNNIYGLARRKSDDTEITVMKLSGIMRFMLYECDKPLIHLSQEIKAVEDYIALEKLRYNQKLNVRFTRNLDDQNPRVAPLLLLPFVENAFKHGASESRHNSNISIDIQFKKLELVYTIKNSVEGNRVENPNGIGMKNVIRQLDLIYPRRYDLKVVQKEKEFCVRLQIELND